MKAVLTGFGIGAVITAMLLAAVGSLAVRRKALDVRRGWNLLPVVVAAVDLAEGETLTEDRISQRSIPEQFVTDSNVRPGEVKPLLGKKISVPVQAGDPLVWGDFIDTSDNDALERCLAAIHPKVKDAYEQAGREAAKGFELGAPANVAQPPVEAGAKGYVKVVAAAEDVSEGTTLTAAQLKVIEVPEAFSTESVVPAGTLPKLVGQKVVAPLQEGELFAWPLLDAKGPMACELQMVEAANRVCPKTAEEAVADWKAQGQK